MTQLTDPAVNAEQHGPWALIAGGSEGVGAEIAFLLADAGIHSVLVARKPEPLEDTAEQVRRRGAQCRTLALDLTAADALEQIVAATGDLEIGLLVLNAGANTQSGQFVDTSAEDVQRVLDLNMGMPMHLIRHYGPAMRQRGRGGILVMGSMAGYLGHEDMATYSAAKAFSRVLVEGLWLELREHGVDVCEAILGVTRTPAMQRAGLDFDLPGITVHEPADAARAALAALPHGPVVVIGGEADEKRVAWSSGTDRARIVAGAAKRMRQLRGA